MHSKTLQHSCNDTYSSSKITKFENEWFGISVKLLFPKSLLKMEGKFIYLKKNNLMIK